MYETRAFRKGLKVQIDGVPYSIVDFQHVSPGKGAAFTRTKMKNLLTGNHIERSIRAGDKLEKADVEIKEMQFLYPEGEMFVFMDNKNYEQTHLNKDLIGDQVGFLVENIEVQVMFFQDRAIGIELPTFVVSEVVKTDPAFKGDTVTGGTKPAIISSGAQVNVPFHIKEGDKIKVDTRESSYVEKVNK